MSERLDQQRDEKIFIFHGDNATQRVNRQKGEFVLQRLLSFGFASVACFLYHCCHSIGFTKSASSSMVSRSSNDGNGIDSLNGVNLI